MQVVIHWVLCENVRNDEERGRGGALRNSNIDCAFWGVLENQREFQTDRWGMSLRCHWDIKSHGGKKWPRAGSVQLCWQMPGAELVVKKGLTGCGGTHIDYFCWGVTVKGRRETQPQQATCNRGEAEGDLTMILCWGEGEGLKPEALEKKLEGRTKYWS